MPILVPSLSPLDPAVVLPRLFDCAEPMFPLEGAFVGGDVIGIIVGQAIGTKVGNVTGLLVGLTEARDGDTIIVTVGARAVGFLFVEVGAGTDRGSIVGDPPVMILTEPKVG